MVRKHEFLRNRIILCFVQYELSLPKSTKFLVKSNTYFGQSFDCGSRGGGSLHMGVAGDRGVSFGPGHLQRLKSSEN